MLGNLIGGFVVIIVGVSLMPAVADEVRGSIDANGSNVTGAAATILDLTILFFALAIAAAGIAIAVQGLRAAGMLGV